MRHIHIPLLLAVLMLMAGSASAKNPGKIKFGICTDVHLPTMHDSEQRISAFISTMKKEQPDFIIELGDFATPDPRFAPLFAIWNSFPGDKYHVIGNHEMDGGYTREKTMAYLKLEKSYYSFNKNGFHFIVLDGNDKKNPEAKGYKQYMADEQLNWLTRDLEATSFPVIIFSHQGLVEYKGADETYGVENWQQVQGILNAHNASHPGKRVVACFNGHTHYDDAVNVGGIWYITITSMSYHWLGEKYAHETYGEAVDKQFKWIKYTAPFRDPLFATVEISAGGTMKIKGRKSAWVGKTPWELGYPETQKKYMRPEVSSRKLKLSL